MKGKCNTLKTNVHLDFLKTPLFTGSRCISIQMMAVFVLMLLLSITCNDLHAGPTGRVPDTGQTQSYTVTFGEDSDYLINPPSYTKLGAGGVELLDDATDWLMVRDNITGLIWEVKIAPDGKADYTNLHDADNAYTWYNSNPSTNGGNAGTAGDGTDTEDFINAMNSNAYGGYSDWCMPIFPSKDPRCQSACFRAKANDLEPYWYLRYLLVNLPEAMTEDDFRALLPQNVETSQLAGPPYLS